MRVHELAKELGVTSKEMIAEIKKLGGEVKNHMSHVEDAILEKLSKTKPSKGAEPEKKAAAKPGSKKEAPKKEEPKREEPKREPVKVEAPVTPVELPKSAPAAAPVKKKVVIRFPVTVGALAADLKMRLPELIKALMTLGVFANINQLLNEEIVFTLAEQLGVEIEKLPDEAEAALQETEKEDPSLLKSRPPVVTMMGHVDHGKTSLLDAIRSTNVAAREKGAITQHIGAYGVDIEGRGHVTFIDTPGHEAFTAMRARGANVTDVVVLVVAADDGVMPQTVEAIDHAREANCPIIVAINKCDLPAANPQRVMTGLQKYDLMAEEWGGKTIFVKVSAKDGTGISQLLEMLLLEAEVLELKANPDCHAYGAVIEGHLSKGSGAVATVIVQKGTLRIGDAVVCGCHMGRVKALRNDRGKSVKEAGPSYATELSGLSGVPEAGETFQVVQDEKIARRISEKRSLAEREIQMRGASKHLSLEGLYELISEGSFKELKLIIKADVQGSMEALATALEKLGTDQCRIRAIHKGVGGVNESDVVLAAASDAVILGFHVKADSKAQEIAEKEKVDVRFYNIIYEAVEDVRKAMEGLLEPIYQEVIEGKFQVRKIFTSKKAGTIAGGMVIKGKITRNNRARVVRNQVVVYDGKLGSLKRFQDDVRDVQQGYECGIVFSSFNDLREGDIVESYRMDKIAAKL
ncbi:translation initiation factor IF-2 [Omnitrophica bacterium]|nr:translation initiation factor IF-2 [Candidatus Omnitrophota bacterium]